MQDKQVYVLNECFSVILVGLTQVIRRYIIGYAYSLNTYATCHKTIENINIAGIYIQHNQQIIDVLILLKI